jgi:hypothetical protein
MRALILMFLLVRAAIAEPWLEAIEKMPLSGGAVRVYKMAPVRAFFAALRPNDLIKGIIFLPAATDQLYFFDQGELTGVRTLGAALRELPRKTSVKTAFKSPFILIYATGDSTNAPVLPEIPNANEVVLDRAEFVDRSWEQILPSLGAKLTVEIRPKADSPEAWHFYRACFAGRQLTRHEVLTALAWSTKTRVRISPDKALTFELLAP